jgi:hypothetical protein
MSIKHHFYTIGEDWALLVNNCTVTGLVVQVGGLGFMTFKEAPLVYIDTLKERSLSANDLSFIFSLYN